MIKLQFSETFEESKMDSNQNAFTFSAQSLRKYWKRYQAPKRIRTDLALQLLTTRLSRVWHRHVSIYNFIFRKGGFPLFFWLLNDRLKSLQKVMHFCVFEIFPISSDNTIMQRFQIRIESSKSQKKLRLECNKNIPGNGNCFHKSQAIFW